MNTLADDPDEEKRLMFGMLYSLKELTSKISPSEGDQGLHVMKTDTYTLHHFESVTGMIFILNTDAETSGGSFDLSFIFSIAFLTSFFIDIFQICTTICSIYTTIFMSNLQFVILYIVISLAKQ